MPTEPESSLATRASLLARLKDWNQQTAWQEFAHVYAPLLRNVARKAGLTDTESDEVVQEALIAVAKKIREFEHAGNRGSFRAWLYQQARWRIADQFRSRARSQKSDAGSVWAAPTAADADEPAGESGYGNELQRSTYSAESAVRTAEVDPEFQRIWDAEWDQHMRHAALERVKRKVSGSQYQLFDLHVLQGLSVRATAQAAGTTQAAVYMAKSRVGRLVRREVNTLKAKCP